MTDSLSETRKRAWKTRRAKYGARGHAGSYWRGTVDTDPLRQRRQLSRLVAFCLTTGTLGEGQVSRILEIDRISVRELRDDGREQLAVRPLSGHWGAAVMKEIENEL